MAGGFDSIENLQKKTLTICHDVLKKKLDVNEILSWMDQKNLLTADDRHVLSDTSKSTAAKVRYIIEILPRKGKGWWEKFIASLRESTSGTAHEYLASVLTRELKRKMIECGQRSLEPTAEPHSRDSCTRLHYDSVRVPSGISLDMYDFMPDMMSSKYTEPILGSDKETPDIAKVIPADLAHIIKPIVELKKKMDSIQYCHKVMKNQVGLLQAFDELIKNTNDFCDALSDLLNLYINKFKTKKQCSSMQLTTVEQYMTQIIEDITECTEDIDINKEKEMWAQCVEKIKKNRDLIKEALYSQDTIKMAKIQETLKLDGMEAENAKEWIAIRKQVVVLGYKNLARLDEMRSQDDALVTAMYDTVYRRVKVGEDCLNAWAKWIEQRIKL